MHFDRFKYGIAVYFSNNFPVRKPISFPRQRINEHHIVRTISLRRSCPWINEERLAWPPIFLQIGVVFATEQLKLIITLASITQIQYIWGYTYHTSQKIPFIKLYILRIYKRSNVSVKHKMTHLFHDDSLELSSNYVSLFDIYKHLNAISDHSCCLQETSAWLRYCSLQTIFGNSVCLI